jgi:hypothetical protein
MAKASHATTSADTSYTSSCRQPNTPPISLRESDVVQRHTCAAGAHIVFIGTTGLGSMVMRGRLTHSIINQSFARHGAHSSYIFITDPKNASNQFKMVERHFDSIGGAPAACVIIKYSVAWVGAACRRRGALVLVDSVDQHRAFTQSTLRNEHYAAMDAIIVQTEAHAAMLSSWGHVSVVLPHPHGNLGLWGVATEVRQSVRGVGFVVQDPKNMPNSREMRGIFRACCKANATFYLVGSRKDGLNIRPYADRVNCTDGNSTSDRYTWPERNVGETCHSSTSGHGRRSASFPGAGWSVGDVAQVQDETQQRAYYDSPRLLEMIDVGIVWRPGHQQGGPIAVANRPPTRLHWWWSHGIPVVGYPMNAYVDAARRVGYPEDLLNLTSTEDIELALSRISPSSERSCLQRIAHSGAHLSSPWFSSLEVLTAICALGERCGRPLQLTHTGARSRQAHASHTAFGGKSKATGTRSKVLSSLQRP